MAVAPEMSGTAARVPLFRGDGDWQTLSPEEAVTSYCRWGRSWIKPVQAYDRDRFQTILRRQIRLH